MKPYLLLSVFSIIFLSCNNNDVNDKSKRNAHWAWWVDARTNQGRWIPIKDETTVDKGKYTLFYFNGNIRETGKLDNGKRVDTIFGYDINGKLNSCKILSEKIWYFFNDGPMKLYFASGQLSDSGIIKNHRHGDKWVSYYENGDLRYVDNFVRDTGWEIQYYENGQLKDSLFHVKGSRDFNLKYWYENGKIKESNEIKNNNFNGIIKTYYENGQIQDSSIMIDGKREGIAFQWFENGQLEALDNYKNGKLDGKQITYHENGQTKTVGYLDNGILSGEVKQYNDSGRLVSDAFYKDGVKIK